MYLKRDFFYKSAHRLLLEKSLKILLEELQKKSFYEKIIDFGSGNPRYTSFLPNSHWIFFDKIPQESKNVFFATEKNIPAKNKSIDE